MGDCDLAAWFGELAASLPTDLTNPPKVVLDPETVPRPPRTLATSALIVETRTHDYNPSWRVDMIDFMASRSTIRQLGVLIMASLLVATDEAIEVRLLHPASDVKLLRIGGTWASVPEGLQAQPVGFVYWAGQPGRHPWLHEEADPYDLPQAHLRWRDPMGDITGNREERDVVDGFGNRAGAARFAELLLNAGNPANPDDEYQLECEGGFRGVGPQSAEIRIWLPHSFGWVPDFGLDPSGESHRAPSDFGQEHSPVGGWPIAKAQSAILRRTP